MTRYNSASMDDTVKHRSIAERDFVRRFCMTFVPALLGIETSEVAQFAKDGQRAALFYRLSMRFVILEL